MKQALIVVLILLGGLAAACGAQPAASPTAAPGLANPASEFCEDQGYTVEIREGETGQVGYCVFPDGSECEEWAFYRGECAGPGGDQATPAQVANPASENCVAQGGTVMIATRPNESQYGICLFEDNMQCEEWALMHGDCPPTGVKITGYATEAGVYCAITGGEYAVTANANTPDEQGTCTYEQYGIVCDDWEWANTNCPFDDPAFLPRMDGLGGGSAQIVFDSTRHGAYRDLYQSYTGGSEERLTAGESDSIAGPYSPDGTRVVYTTFGLTHSDIAVVNADGSGQALLTDTPDVDEGFPAWSPDGTKIAFTTGRDGNNEIYVMPAPEPQAEVNADGSTLVRLTDQAGDDFGASWSPDGTQIVFVSDRDQTAGVYDLYIMNADGSGVKRLTNDTAIDYSPNWSPDGKKIVFRSDRDGESDIYVMDIDPSPGNVTNLTNRQGEDWAPTWSPDGTVIAFQTNRDGNWEVYLMAPDGTILFNLTRNGADDQMPFWRP